MPHLCHAEERGALRSISSMMIYVVSEGEILTALHRRRFALPSASPAQPIPGFHGKPVGRLACAGYDEAE
ncbi:hypothetical protein TFLX_02208 [Thermoflexales bacterium]|nr:hypothetical protein TFLX_02208 [Thermoflexales bacterium]